MRDRNKLLVILGIVVLTIGLSASFYKVMERVGQPPGRVTVEISYPYQNIGIVLVIIAIMFFGLVLLFPFKKNKTSGARTPKTER